MEEISLVRFNAIAGYARKPLAQTIAEEIAFFEGADGSVMGTLIRDREDNKFFGMIFGRDKKLRFRSTSMTDFFQTPGEALEALSQKMQEMLDAPAERL